MKTQHVLLIIIIYLIFFRKPAVTVQANSTALRSAEFDILERDYKERIEMLEKKIIVAQDGPLI